MSERTALLTGGSGSIGRAIAAELSRDGLDVAVGYHSDESGARAAAETVESNGGRAAILQGDVGDPDDARELVDGARELGPLSVLVNAAGVADPGPLESAPERIG